MKANIPDRTYYKIGEVSSILGVKPHIVRYWVSEFSQIRLKKTKSGQRLFTRRDIDLLLAIERLVIGQEYTVSGAKARLQELRDIGVKHQDLYDAIERLQNVDLLEHVLIRHEDEGAASHRAARQEHPRTQESFDFESGRERASETRTNRPIVADQVHRSETRDDELKQLHAQLQAAQQNEASLRQQLLEAQRDHTQIVHERTQQLEALQQELQQERDALARRIALTQQSLLEERQFYADEQNILTLYIEELEESLYHARQESSDLKLQLENYCETLAALRSEVQTRAMQQRYALQKAAHNAKRHNEARGRLRTLVKRLQERVHAEQAKIIR